MAVPDVSRHVVFAIRRILSVKLATFLVVLLLLIFVTDTVRAKKVTVDAEPSSAESSAPSVTNGGAKKLKKIIGSDADHWVDPHNMFDYAGRSPTNDEEGDDTGEDDDVISEDTGDVPYTPKREKPLKNTMMDGDLLLDEEQQRRLIMTTRERKECSDLRKEHQKCRRQLQELQMRSVLELDDDSDVNGDAIDCNKREFIYLRRLALNIAYQAKYGSEETLKAPVKLDLLLSPSDVKKLEKLAHKPCSKAGDLEALISSIFASSTVTPEDGPPPRQIEKVWTQISSKSSMYWIIPSLGIIGVFVLIGLRGRSWSVCFVTLFLYMLFVSVIWHWIHLLKEHEARKAAFFAQLEGIEDPCKLDISVWKVSTYGTFLRSVFGFDTSAQCREAHRHQMVDSILEVSPLEVFVEALAKVVFRPVKVAGNSLGTFLNEFYAAQSWTAVIVGTMVLIILTVSTLLITRNYSLSFGWGLFSMSSSHHQLINSASTALPSNMMQASVENPRIEEIVGGAGDGNAIIMEKHQNDHKKAALQQQQRDVNYSENTQNSRQQQRTICLNENNDKYRENKKEGLHQRGRDGRDAPEVTCSRWLPPEVKPEVVEEEEFVDADTFKTPPPTRNSTIEDSDGERSHSTTDSEADDSA